MNIDIARFAEQEFARRRQTARGKVASRTLDADVAELHLRPWLALALRCGADPASLDQDLPEQIAGRAPACSGGTARALVALDYCPADEALAVLARARDHAVSREDGTPDRAERAYGLVLMGMHLGAPPPSREAIRERLAA